MRCLVGAGCCRFKHRAPAHNAQEGKVDYRYLAWCPSSRSEKYFAGSTDSCRVFHCTNCIIYISNFQVAQAALPRVRPTTWYFALRLQMPDFSIAEKFATRSAPFSTTRNKQSLYWKTSRFLRCAGRRFRIYSRIFALLEQDCRSLCPRMVFRR